MGSPIRQPNSHEPAGVACVGQGDGVPQQLGTCPDSASKLLQKARRWQGKMTRRQQGKEEGTIRNTARRVRKSIRREGRA